MKIYELNVDEEYFKLNKILYGQCFRWKKQEDEKYIGVIDNNVIKIWQKNDKLFFYGINNKNIEKNIYEYFDLDTNYRKIIIDIQRKCNNELLNEIIDYSKGTRILNQSMFEIVISYIFSASNNIPRIEGSIEKISMMYGDKVLFEGKEYYLFPTINKLKDVNKEEYKEYIRIGFRSRYVEKTIRNLLTDEYNLENINKMDTIKARKKLISLDGVGPKVADCILLFSMKKKDVFPVDTWINKVMQVYANNEKITKKEIADIVRNDFGEYSGIINHYMFYWGRENKI